MPVTEPLFVAYVTSTLLIPLPILSRESVIVLIPSRSIPQSNTSTRLTDGLLVRQRGLRGRPEQHPRHHVRRRQREERVGHQLRLDVVADASQPLLLGEERRDRAVVRARPLAHHLRELRHGRRVEREAHRDGAVRRRGGDLAHRELGDRAVQVVGQRPAEACAAASRHGEPLAERAEDAELRAEQAEDRDLVDAGALAPAPASSSPG